METFCTIITADYFPKAIVLYQSLRRFNPGLQLQVLVSDAATPLATSRYPGIHPLTIDALVSDPLVHELYKKYAHTNPDSFRWALKPILINHLLEKGYARVIYTDCDIFFTGSYDFLLDELDTAGVLLTPHWLTIDPLLNENDFVTTFVSGMFNAGFIGVSKKGIPAMNWWARACHFKMGAFNAMGIHDDQKYLDIFPVFFEPVKIVRHKGCNVATWNYHECKRVLVNGEVLINGTYPIIFIHFNHVLIREILKGHDPHLHRYFEEYKKMYEDEGFSLESYMKEMNYYANAPAVLRLKWKLKLRTRAKAWLYRLAESL